VQERAAGAVDGAGVEGVQRQDVARFAFGVVEVQVGQALPAATNADHFGAHLDPAVSHLFDDRVEAGDVAAACEDNDSLGHALSWVQSLVWISGIKLDFSITGPVCKRTRNWQFIIRGTMDARLDASRLESLLESARY
jgi:hypothetical protein